MRFWHTSQYEGFEELRSMPRQDECAVLSASQAQAFLAGPVGKLTALAQEAVATAPFVVLDHFDQTLRKTGRMFYQSGTQMTLMFDDGKVLNQIGPRAGNRVQDLPDGPVRQALRDMSPLRSLVPVGTGSVQRAIANFVDVEGKSRCRASIDTFNPTGGAGFVLVRLSGLRGYEKSLASVRAHALTCGGVPLDLGTLYRYLCPELVAYEAKPDVAFEPDDSAFSVTSTIIAAYIPVARANEAGIVDDIDTEFLHDYRVALRKIRSVLSLFKGVYSEAQTAALKSRFSALMEPTGPLRDIDVFLLDKQGYYDLLPASLHGGLDAQFGLLLKQRKTAKACLSRHLQSKVYALESSALSALFVHKTKLEPGPNAESKVSTFACDLIWKRYRKILRISRQISHDTDDSEVHALRIECKKLRYLLESFGNLFPKTEYQSLIKPLKALQDNLGRVHDCEVQQVNLQAMLKSAGRGKSDDSISIAQSIGALTTVLYDRQIKERTKTLEYLAHFGSPRIQETFRELFHARKDRA
jgi:CHAD domain-containing protein